MHRSNAKKNGKITDPVQEGSALKRALKAGSTWDDKDEFLDVIYWTRQVVALINGLAWGFIPIQGILGLILFFIINCALVFFYASKFQQVDEDDYGGPTEIVKEGLFTAFAVFLVSWITVYTATQS
ncbi:GEL complex subunit OPTI-like [Rhopilema esculentum]|uniref:GEL complex subunit OPTI-like n=1 Tax=Rhopilema esculentum TaxID=499914 RepID=UPI0031D1601B